jgi:acetolactate synthase-1/2/3 large subunit
LTTSTLTSGTALPASDATPQRCTGAYALIDSLYRHGVKHIFGYPGGAILPIYDELYRWEAQGLMQHILVRHEQAAGHAADGYARATGRVGVCFGTSGPGATNLVTAIATAHMDSIPMVIITGQVRRSAIGSDAFQETDIFGITLPIVKHSYVVRDPKDMARIVAEAFYIASTGRPGPVLIDIPKDVGEESFDYVPVAPGDVKLAGYRPTVKGNPRQIVQATRLLLSAQRPLLYVGGGAITAGAHREIQQLAEMLQIPVTTTLMGKGAFDERHPLSVGMLGMHGTAYANFAVSQCDVLVALGARFDDRVTGKLAEFAPHARVIHVDVDPAEVGKNRVPEVPIVGDVRQVLVDWIQHLQSTGSNRPRTDAAMVGADCGVAAGLSPGGAPGRGDAFAPGGDLSAGGIGAACLRHDRCGAASDVGGPVFAQWPAAMDFQCGVGDNGVWLTGGDGGAGGVAPGPGDLH